MSTQKNYGNSLLYENFLSRAFRFDQRLSEPSNQEFLNLIDAENGARHNFLPPREKQLINIKDRLKKAVKLFLSKAKLDTIAKKNVLSLVEEIEQAETSTDIFAVVEKGLEYTQALIDR